LFEFVSYALTSDQFQKDLQDEADVSRLQRSVDKVPPKVPYAWTDSPEEIRKNLPESRSKWSEFKLAIAGILKIRNTYLTRSEPDQIRPVTRHN
jgi:hypothetical protein